VVNPSAVNDCRSKLRLEISMISSVSFFFHNAGRTGGSEINGNDRRDKLNVSGGSAMHSRFIYIIGLLALVGCAKPRGETPQSLYVTWTDRINTPLNVTVDQLDGIWERTGEVRLYRDSHDESYNDATGSTFDKSGDLLILSGGRAAKEYLRFSCPYAGEEPIFLFAGLDADASTLSPAFDLKAYIALLMTNQPTAFAPFALDGQKIVTDQILRGRKPSKEKPEEFQPEHFTMKVITFVSERAGSAPNLLQIAYQRTDIEFGVHTVIESYHRLEGEQLVERLKTSRDAKPCTK
jgi:hypothetical protein